MSPTRGASARAVIVAMVGAVAMLALSACASPFGQACTAIGWINSLDVRLDGTADAVAGVAWVELCDDSGCSKTAEQVRAMQTATPGAALPLYQASASGAASWNVSVGMSRPAQVTVTAYAADATVLGATAATPEWARVGGSEQCGGPGAAAPIMVQVAAE
ncbi:hypothetical protein [Subtercola vilae]|uniref:DUF2690 domain-containing protein n=1 Tax=Subtercola vilae TaxID=2056433 RepID=A0A4T2BHL1_9MICO|nr:hypothetical protein [Subtercola vilae]TIH30825.1 hypothetical protein D4765_16900 [Subtercola vilae]